MTAMALAGASSPTICRRACYPIIPRAYFPLAQRIARVGPWKSISLRSISISAAMASSPNDAPAISLSDKAMNHLSKIRAERNEDLRLRIGVKQGGCSGMSYTMDFENSKNTSPDDSIIEYNGFSIVCDPKSLLFIYGMQLDFSDALIGGGFSFKNPNAVKTCSCGKSFGTQSPRSETAGTCES